MIRPIVTYDIHSNNNPAVLTEKTRPVTDFEAAEVVECIQDLNDTLDELIRTEGNKRGAIGLSATQIGVDLAISAVTLGEKRYMFINPEIIEEKGANRLFRIGCFSLYEYRAMVRYNDDVIVRYNNPDGSFTEEEFTGDRSCVLQHEMDHLEGMLLFGRLENGEADLFVPREAKYKDGGVPVQNKGIAAELIRRVGARKVIDTTEYYSSLFNDYTDYTAYAAKDAEKRKDILDIVRKKAPVGSRVLEVGCGTGALAVSLAKEGYLASVVEEDADMADLAKNISKQNGTDVSVYCSEIVSLPFEDDTFEVVYSREVLETLEEFDLVGALDEGLRVAKTFVFEVPTIWNNSNELKGNEILRAATSWKRFLVAHGFNLVLAKEIKSSGNVIFAISR